MCYCKDKFAGRWLTPLVVAFDPHLKYNRFKCGSKSNTRGVHQKPNLTLQRKGCYEVSVGLHNNPVILMSNLQVAEGRGNEDFICSDVKNYSLLKLKINVTNTYDVPGEVRAKNCNFKKHQVIMLII